jgi:putative hydrolase of the HAD superfamily
MKKIKNLVFDLGGVIMNLDVLKTINSFKELGIHNIVNNTGHAYQHSFFYEFEVGRVSEESFLDSLRNLSEHNLSNQEIINAWNQMILDMPKERVEFLNDLKTRYNIFLLSNTNSIHQKKYLDDFKEDHQMSFNSIFKKAYYSHEIGIRKPDMEVFSFILNDSNLKASETIFIDDALSNIESAKNVGLQTYHVQNYNVFDLLKVLEE